MDSTTAPLPPSAPSSVSTIITDSTPYVVIDSHTNREVYRTTVANRHLARAWRDRKDIAYGASRYFCRFASS